MHVCQVFFYNNIAFFIFSHSLFIKPNSFITSGNFAAMVSNSDVLVVASVAGFKTVSVLSCKSSKSSIKVSNLEPMLECLMSTIASAIFFF